MVTNLILFLTRLKSTSSRSRRHKPPQSSTTPQIKRPAQNPPKKPLPQIQTLKLLPQLRNQNQAKLILKNRPLSPSQSPRLLSRPLHSPRQLLSQNPQNQHLLNHLLQNQHRQNQHRKKQLLLRTHSPLLPPLTHLLTHLKMLLLTHLPMLLLTHLKMVLLTLLLTPLTPLLTPTTPRPKALNQIQTHHHLNQTSLLTH